jgi:MFS superfamily sulfate permease-like transporter
MKITTVHNLVLAIHFLIEGILISILAHLFHIARAQYRAIQADIESESNQQDARKETSDNGSTFQPVEQLYKANVLKFTDNHRRRHSEL